MQLNWVNDGLLLVNLLHESDFFKAILILLELNGLYLEVLFLVTSPLWVLKLVTACLLNRPAERGDLLMPTLSQALLAFVLRE